MPDPGVLTGACLAFAVALVVLVDAFLLRRAPFRPRCRACGADARGAIWREDCRCAGCNASLAAPTAAPTAVRWPWAPRASWLVTIASLALGASLATIVLDRWLASRLLRWSDLKPVSWLVLEPNAEAERRMEGVSSLHRRIEADVLSADDARAALRRILGEPEEWPLLWMHDWSDVATVACDEDLIRRWLRARSGVAVSAELSPVHLRAPGLGVGGWSGVAVLRDVRGDAAIIGTQSATSKGVPPWSDRVTVLSLRRGSPGPCTLTVDARWLLAVSPLGLRDDPEGRLESWLRSARDQNIALDEVPVGAVVVEVTRRYTIRGTQLEDGTFEGLSIVDDRLLDEETGEPEAEGQGGER